MSDVDSPAPPIVHAGMTEDECLAQLSALADSKEAGFLVLAEGVLEDFLATAPAERRAAAAVLGHVQERFGRVTAPSPTRADILDAIGEHIVRLLEAGEAEG